MFNLVYSFLKKSCMSPYKKQKCRIWLAKDTRQYSREYRGMMSHMAGNNWALGDKIIDVDTLALRGFVRALVWLFLIYMGFRIL